MTTVYPRFNASANEPRTVVRTLPEVKALLTPDFLTTHQFDCGSHAFVNRVTSNQDNSPIGCAIIRQRTLKGEFVQNIYIASRPSERALQLINLMNSDEARSALPAFKDAYQMNIHFSGVKSFGRDKHPWRRTPTI